jgi:ABC-2 type transport system ATP-binding protein
MALRDVGFTARQGEILGIIGPNGSGKSTLLACVAGLVIADAGEVMLGGRELDSAAQRADVFLLPDGIAPWRDHRTGAVLELWASLHGRARALLDQRVDALSLRPLLNRAVRELSKGERKRLLLVLALLATQPIILLDEPFDGLDLRQLRDATSLLRDEAATGGRAIVLSLHQLSHAPLVCDRLALLHDGRIVAKGTLEELRDRTKLRDGSLEEIFLALT